MIQTTLLAIAVFAIVLIGMSIGVLLSNRKIKGSCGGLNQFRDTAGRPVCDACNDPSPECSGERAKDPATKRDTESTSAPS